MHFNSAVLTPEEHARAEYIAYFIAWFRGGERVPQYDPSLAHEDFCMAAELVLGQREAVVDRGQTSQILSDGTHSFPVETLLGADGKSIPSVSGEIAWSARDGVTFRFEFPHASNADAAPAPFGNDARPPDGSISEVPDTPSWIGTVVGGGAFALFGAGGRVNTNHISVGMGWVSRSIVTGKASFAALDLPISHSMAFRHDTPALRREFLPSFSLLDWPDPETYTYNDSTNQRMRVRNRLVLQADPRLTVYLGSSSETSHGVWVVDEAAQPTSERVPSDAAENARRFLSFLVGRNLPFYWRDTFQCNNRLRRLYLGALRPQCRILGNEQPVPLRNVPEEFSHGVAIGYRLPQLFERFRKVPEEYNLDFVLSPLWTALDGYVDDKLAGVCVSLERLSTAHVDYQKNASKGGAKMQFLAKTQSSALINALAERADEIARTTDISGDVLEIIKKKLANIHQPPNADKLEMIFTHLGINLREEEQEALGNRNRALHGRQTLRGVHLAAVAEELHRFDILRTLVLKAVLRLIDYTGPYMDYGDKPAGRAYSVQQLTEPTATSS